MSLGFLVRDDGCIDLGYPFVKSWLWETAPDEVIMSMIIVDESERRKGHCRRLVHQLKGRYKKIIVPVPSEAFQILLNAEGFVRDGAYWTWNKEDEE